MSTPRIALVHERFTEYGGSEAVVAEFMKIWPGAPVFAPIADAECTRALVTAARLHTAATGLHPIATGLAPAAGPEPVVAAPESSSTATGFLTAGAGFSTTEPGISAAGMGSAADGVNSPVLQPHAFGAVPASAIQSIETSSATDGLVYDTWLSRVHAASGRRSHAPLLPFVPGAFRALALRADYDAVVVSHHAFATQAVFATDAPVIAYVHSPARWAWDSAFRAREAGGRAGQAILAVLGAMARRNELRAAPRLAHVVANSQAVADRVRDWWGLPASVVNPPVRVDRFSPDPTTDREDFFLFAGRLVPYKRPDLAVRAARQAGVRLVILGDGRYRRQLESLAGPETTFLGAASDEVLQDMYRRCRALLMPGVEDFGIVPVEAMACGAPVLAVGEGGALDTVVPGISGEHIPAGPDDAVVAGFARVMRDFDQSAYHAEAIRKHAATFSPEAFRTRIADIVSRNSR